MLKSSAHADRLFNFNLLSLLEPMRKFAFIFFLPLTLNAQSIFYEKIFGTGGNDNLRAVKEFPNGTIFTAGFSDSGVYGGIDVSLSKLDKFGNLIWTKFYGNSYNNWGLYLNKTSDNCLVICGETQTASNLLDAFLYKIDTSGNVVWQQYYSSLVNESFKHVIETSDGGFLLSGFKNDSYGSNDTYVVKADALGNYQWDLMIGGTDNEYADMGKETPEGDFIVTGDTRSFGSGGYDVEVTKFNSSGFITWDSLFGDVDNNGCQGIYINSENKYISYGETEISTFSPFDFYIEKIDTNGSSIWRQTFGGALADAAFGLTELPDKGFMLCGYSNNYPQPAPLNLVVLRTDSQANMQWVRAYGGPGIDIGYEIIPSVLGGFIICGIYSDSVNLDAEYYLLHVDDDGLLTGQQETAAANTISIFPNPSIGVFSLEFGVGSGEKAEIEIYNSIGEEVYKSEVKSQKEVINLSTQPKGIYFVRIVANDKTYSQKIVIQ